jgi:hypothetical protein
VLAEVQLGLRVAATAETPQTEAGDARRRALLVEPDVKEASTGWWLSLSLSL